MKLQVLIADSDPDFQRTMTQALSREGDMEAAGVSSDGLETLSLIQTARPDVVLLDLIQQRLDGLGILRRLAGREDAPPVLVLTGFVNAAVVAECAKLGAAYFIPKPCDTAALMQCLRQCAKAGGKSPAAAAAPAPVPAHLESAVTDVLHEIGVPAHIKGYQFLRDAILLTISDHGYINAVTKRLYPEIAKRNMTTASRVERAIRHAIEVAWDRGDVDTLNSYFGYTIHNLRGKPTNSEFIAMISDKIRLDKKRHA